CPRSQFALNDIRVTKLECAKRHIDGMTRHVPEGAGPEVVPTAPLECMVRVFLVWPLRSGAEPTIPIQGRRNRILARRPIQALRPNGAIAPDMQLERFADDAGLNDFDGPTQPALGAALVAHLGGQFLFGGQPAQCARFVNSLGQRLLAKTVLTQL